ncbi:MAG: GTP-binding protein [Lachnospiraceae bacterium]|nr:GTP-binding protein [Lachnospiraceae bacterium]
MTKIDIISGFLGAGKTTLIRKLLEESLTKEKVVLIENEYGEVGIDGGFLKDAGIEITEMTSGCICCTLVGDFAKALREVLEKYHPDRIIIEPSGVGKLSDVMQSVTDFEKEADVKLNSLVTVVNALKAERQMKGFGEFFNNQIQFATTVILSRTQSAKNEQLTFAQELIKKLNPKAAVITTAWDSIPGDKILSVMEGQDNLEIQVLAEKQHAVDKEAHDAEHHHHDHDHHHDHEDHDHEHEHHHDHDEHDHDHEHEHHHDHEDHDHEHEHHHDHEDHDHDHHHDHDEHDHDHHHDHEHDHDHHHHHHADDIFTSWGKETPKRFERSVIEDALKTFRDTNEVGEVLRAKGMVEDIDGQWIYFDMVSGEYEIRNGEPDYTGRLVVIGTDLNTKRIEELFGL